MKDLVGGGRRSPLNKLRVGDGGGFSAAEGMEGSNADCTIKGSGGRTVQGMRACMEEAFAARKNVSSSTVEDSCMDTYEELQSQAMAPCDEGRSPPAPLMLGAVLMEVGEVSGVIEEGLAHDHGVMKRVDGSMVDRSACMNVNLQDSGFCMGANSPTRVGDAICTSSVLCNASKTATIPRGDW